MPGHLHKNPKRYTQRKKICLAALSAVFVFTSLLPVLADKTTGQQLDETAAAIEALRQSSAQAKERLDEANREKGVLGEKLDDLKHDLEEVQQALEDIEARIEKKNAQIEATEQELSDMEEKRARQYESMKVRIRFMYEHSDASMLESFFGAQSMSEFLNRVEYFTQVVSYDRQQLEEYQTLLTDLAEKKTLREEQKQELVAILGEQQEQFDKLSALIADTREDLQAAGAAAKDAADALDALDDKLQEQLAYEEALEAQKAAEDQARMDEIRQQEEELKKKKEEEKKRREEEEKKRQEEEKNQPQKPADSTPGTEETDPPPEQSPQPEQPASAEDLELLAAIIQCEAEGEPYEGKLAVGSVVMNRVHSSSFPNTVMGVIYQPGQFSPVASGRFASRLAAGSNSVCIQAAREVLNGNITVPYLYFRRNNGTIDGYVIGNHVFY